jgi:hypothetical protein
LVETACIMTRSFVSTKNSSCSSGESIGCRGTNGIPSKPKFQRFAPFETFVADIVEHGQFFMNTNELSLEKMGRPSFQGIDPGGKLLPTISVFFHIKLPGLVEVGLGVRICKGLRVGLGVGLGVGTGVIGRVASHLHCLGDPLQLPL